MNPPAHGVLARRGLELGRGSKPFGAAVADCMGFWVRLLKRKRKLKAKLTGSVFDGVGQTASLVSTLKLKLKGKKHT
ncbi:MAG: hypothetical protein WBQ41_09660 [Solirubrobacterales bacterium]